MVLDGAAGPVWANEKRVHTWKTCYGKDYLPMTHRYSLSNPAGEKLWLKWHLNPYVDTHALRHKCTPVNTHTQTSVQSEKCKSDCVKANIYMQVHKYHHILDKKWQTHSHLGTHLQHTPATKLTGYSSPVHFSKCVILLPLFIYTPPIPLSDGGDMCTLLCCHGYHKHPTQKILHRIISGQLRLFALQQTSGLEAFSCQRHKLFLCLQGKRKEGEERREGKEEGGK